MIILLDRMSGTIVEVGAEVNTSRLNVGVNVVVYVYYYNVRTKITQSVAS